MRGMFFSSDLYKEQMHSNKFLNEYLSAYTIPRQRAPQNHRTGFVICRIVQAQTGSTENDWGYAGGKKQTNTISKGHVLLHYVVPCSAIHSRIILKDFPFLLASLEDFIYTQSLKLFPSDFTTKLRKIISASSRFVQQHSSSIEEVTHDTRLTLTSSFKKNK